MTDKTTWRILATSCIAISIFAFNLWLFFGKGVYYKGIAVHFILTYTLVYAVTKFRITDKYVHNCGYIGLLLSMRYFLDECVFDATKLEFNDLITLLIVLLLILFKQLINARSTRTRRVTAETKG